MIKGTNGEQADFRKNRSTIQQTFALRLIAEKAK